MGHELTGVETGNGFPLALGSVPFSDDRRDGTTRFARHGERRIVGGWMNNSVEGGLGPMAFITP